MDTSNYTEYMPERTDSRGLERALRGIRFRIKNESKRIEADNGFLERIERISGPRSDPMMTVVRICFEHKNNSKQILFYRLVWMNIRL
jgi:hypothetical protein